MGKNLYNRKEGGTMKKILSIVSLIGLVVMFTGCGSQKEVKNLQDKVNELQAKVDELNTTVIDISQGMETMRAELEKKNIVKKGVIKPIKVRVK